MPILIGEMATNGTRHDGKPKDFHIHGKTKGNFQKHERLQKSQQKFMKSVVL